ncbi:hypothetical protein NPIL_50071 [Nephila pilipes]|uniref:Uncharacterized protein n=1 Tax=Nephila pilipes TaxID=299642 RepID=A0A8X6TIC3_NEPPI|nr:hypothetical protein NPIL_50071 [Nephila pilipes]
MAEKNDCSMETECGCESLSYSIEMKDKKTLSSAPEGAESIEYPEQAKANRNAASSIRREHRNIDCTLKINERRYAEISKRMTFVTSVVLVVFLWVLFAWNVILLRISYETQYESASKETNLTFGNASSVLVIDGIQNGEWSNEAKAYATAEMLETTKVEERTSVTLQLGSTSLNKTMALYLANKTEGLHLKEAV